MLHGSLNEYFFQRADMAGERRQVHYRQVAARKIEQAAVHGLADVPPMRAVLTPELRLSGAFGRLASFIKFIFRLDVSGSAEHSSPHTREVIVTDGAPIPLQAEPGALVVGGDKQIP